MKPIDSLTPEELRVEIAESLGWKDLTQDGSVGTSPQGQGRWTPPNWSRDANAALTLAGALAEHQWAWTCSCTPEGECEIEFGYDRGFVGRATGPHAFPLALSRAYLAVTRSTKNAQ